MKRRLDSETDVRVGMAGADRVVAYRMIPEVARALGDLLLEYALTKGDGGFEADARNLRRCADKADRAEVAS